jgi:hypothetical protein
MSGAKKNDLWEVVKILDEDYTPYGQLERWADEDKGYPDCSCGCKYFKPLFNEEHKDVGDLDWGICANPNSHRAGLLTFEHQGCLKFEQDEEKTWMT